MSDPRTLVLDETDLAIVHALQVDARAPWSRVADVVGVDAATVARRWADLSEAGWAWSTLWPTPQRHSARSDAALVRVSDRVSDEVVEAWADLPWVLTLDRTSAGVLALVAGRGGLAALHARVDEAFTEPGLDVAVEFAAAVPRADSTWQVSVLADHQVRSLAADRTDPGAGRAPSEEVVDEVAAALAADVRAPLVTLAAHLGVSEATARRTLARVRAHRLLHLGCDVAMPAVGLGRGVVVRARPRTAHAVPLTARHPSVHRSLLLVGPAPLTLHLALTSLTEVWAIEEAWAGEIEVLDRWTVTSRLKRNGAVLAADGRVRRTVPVGW